MKNFKGFLIIETLISIVILTMVLLSLFSMVSFLQRRTVKSGFETDASLLMQEGMEIAHTALLANWEKYDDGVYSPAFDAVQGNWVLVEGEETNLQALFTRKIELTKVCRNPVTGEKLDISGSCTGILDENTRTVKTTISWSDKGQMEEIAASLLVLKLP